MADCESPRPPRISSNINTVSISKRQTKTHRTREKDNLKQVLVSVRDLVEQFGPVVFDEFGVYVNGTNGGADSGKGRTRIGAPTVNRLYRFDYRALCQHARARGRIASAG